MAVKRMRKNVKEKLAKKIIEFMTELGAVKNNEHKWVPGRLVPHWYDYMIDTKLGRYHFKVDYEEPKIMLSVFGMFEDVDEIKLLKETHPHHPAAEANPYSGKWNFHTFGVDPVEFFNGFTWAIGKAMGREFAKIVDLSDNPIIAPQKPEDASVGPEVDRPADNDRQPDVPDRRTRGKRKTVKKDTKKVVKRKPKP